MSTLSLVCFLVAFFTVCRDISCFRLLLLRRSVRKSCFLFLRSIFRSFFPNQAFISYVLYDGPTLNAKIPLTCETRCLFLTALLRQFSLVAVSHFESRYYLCSPGDRKGKLRCAVSLVGYLLLMTSPRNTNQPLFYILTLYSFTRIRSFL